MADKKHLAFDVKMRQRVGISVLLTVTQAKPGSDMTSVCLTEQICNEAKTGPVGVHNQVLSVLHAPASL